MNLRLPESGSLLESLLSGLGKTAAEGPGGTTVSGVTDAQLTEALDALTRGDIEYVILENGDAFLQAAGTGPFALQFSPGNAGDMTEVPGGVDESTLRAALSSYLHASDRWRTQCNWRAM